MRSHFYLAGYCVIHFNRFLYAGGNPLSLTQRERFVKGGPAFQNDGVTAQCFKRGPCAATASALFRPKVAFLPSGASKQGIEIRRFTSLDLYMGIEPEDFLRWCIFADCTATNTFDAGMVVGIYAADTGSSKTEYRDTDGNIDEKLKEHGIDTPFNWMNGLNGLHNRSGGEERNHEILASVLADGTLISETGHYDINGVGQNSNRTTINLIEILISNHKT